MSEVQARYVKFIRGNFVKSKYSPKSNYKSTLKHLSRKHIIANPESTILKRTVVMCSILLIVSSITPAEPLIASNFDLDGAYNPYLNQEDIAYNQSQIIATQEGFLVKNNPFDMTDSDERIQFQIHTVKENEALKDIAKAYGLEVATIVAENSIVNIDDVLPGDELSIPPIDGLTHTVNKRETLSSIANKYKVDFYDIEKYNVVNTKSIAVGKKLFIPGATRVTKRISIDNTIQPTPTSANCPNLETELATSVFPKIP